MAASNSAAFAALDAQADRLRRLANINEDCTREVGEAFEAKIAANVAAQVDPYEHAWPPSKDGLPLLINAASHIKVRAVGTSVEIALDDVEVRHHVGSAKGYHGGSSKLGGFRRAIIPFSKLPGPFKAIVREILTKHFGKIFKVAA